MSCHAKTWRGEKQRETYDVLRSVRDTIAYDGFSCRAASRFYVPRARKRTRFQLRSMKIQDAFIVDRCRSQSR